MGAWGTLINKMIPSMIDKGVTMSLGSDSNGAAGSLDMKAGLITVVPKGRWHRFHAPDGVTVPTATPQPTDHSTAEDPTRR